MPTFVPDEVVTAAKLNSGTARDWTPWTPTLTNLTLGSGLLVARYMLLGSELCVFRIRFTFGAGSAVSSVPRFSVPPGVTPSPSYTDFNDPIGLTLSTDATVATYPGMTVFADSLASIRPFGMVTSAANATMLTITATAPFTWGTGDVLSVSGEFEVA